MKHISEIFSDMLRIRGTVKGYHSAALGLLPLFLILGIWLYVTWGKTFTIELPEGIIEGTNTPPVNGLRAESGTRFFIPNAKTEYDQTTDLNYTIVGEKRIQLPFYVQNREGGVLIKLPAGTFVKTKVQTPSPEPASTPSTESPKKPIGRGGTRTAPATSESPATSTTSDQAEVFSFRYEQVETRLFPATLLPSPSEVVRAFPSLFSGGTLVKNISTSFVRVGGGFFVAILVAFPLGIMMGSFAKIKSMFNPLLVFGGYTPIPALVPLSIIMFGFNEKQKVMFLALAFAIYLIPLIVSAVDEVDNVYLQTAYTLGASRFQTVMHILIGIALPRVYDSMRLGFGVGWSYIMLVEMVDMGAGGIGAALLVCQKRSLTAEFYLNLIVIVVIAFLTDKLWEKTGDWLFPYRRLKR
ncbi:MAG: ABC transporter permease subunit [Candidatus Riflebacteria bacterium]|nr:ABC transporter permease subunit [Candidatus Riflebacteria bacterium]